MVLRVRFRYHACRRHRFLGLVQIVVSRRPTRLDMVLFDGFKVVFGVTHAPGIEIGFESFRGLFLLGLSTYGFVWDFEMRILGLFRNGSIQATAR